MELNKTYRIPEGTSVQSTAYALAEFLDLEKNLTTQTSRTKKGYLVECIGDNGAEWTKYIGADSRVSIDFSQYGEELEVTVTIEKWKEKAAMAAAGAIFFHPLVISSSIGFVRQLAVTTDIFRFVEDHLGVKPISNIPEPTPEPEPEPLRTMPQFRTICPSCHTENKEGSHFCRTCGKSLQEPEHCPACGSELDGDEAFCTNCGAKITR